MKHKVAIIVGILAVTGLSVGAYYARRGEAAPAIVTGGVTRGRSSARLPRPARSRR